MKISRGLFVGIWLILGALTAGCAAAYAAPLPNEPPAQATVTQMPADEIMDQLIGLLPDAAPPTSNCLDCHSDAELLQALAEEEDVPEVPSEGSG
jgi:hypothetical protein